MKNDDQNHPTGDASKDPVSHSTTGQRWQMGRYEIAEHIATGGMAQIYKAYSNKNKAFIIKKVLPEFSKNEDFVRMFVEEAKISLSLKHPNVVRVLDLGQMEGSYYLAMEYVFGKDLGSLLKKSLEARVHIPIDVACFIIMQCCRGLDYAHHSKDSFGNTVSIVHRDISPPNILVSFNGEAKVLDFGIAKAVSAMNQSNTRSGVLKGKFCYMSPEQARGEALNHQSDQFSLGIVLHELLTSKSLFYTKDEIETLERVRKANVPAPSKLRKGVPKELDKIVLKALQLKKNKRFENCGELANALQIFLRKNYPRTDARSVAKVLRGLFQPEFRLKMNLARKEGWKDVFVSGAADQDILLDKTLNSPSQIGARQIITRERIPAIHRLLYDPKTSQKFYAGLRAAGYVLALAGLSYYFWNNGQLQKVYDYSYRAFQAKSLFVAFDTETPDEPEIQALTKNTEIQPNSIQPGSFAYFMEESEKQESSGNLTAALENLNRAVRINRFDLAAQTRRNLLLIQTGNSKEGCSWFEAEKEVPQKDLLFARALCRQAEGDPASAVSYYKQYLRNYPSDGRNSKIQQVVETLSAKENN